MENENTIVDIREVDENTKEELVEQSGIRIWLTPKPWIRRITENKKKTAIIAVATLVVLALISTAVIQTLTVNDQKETISALETQNTQLDLDVKSADGRANRAESKVFVCQTELENAWVAWDRRNQLIVTVLSNIFSADTTAIETDNTLAALDFLNAKDCNAGLDYNAIFKSGQ